MILFFVLFFLIFFFTAWKKPIFALGIILFLLPTYLARFNLSLPFVSFQIPTTFLELLVVIFLFASALKVSKSFIQRTRDFTLINWVAGIFVFAGLVSVIISPEPMKALGLLKAYVLEPVLLFYASLLCVKNKEDLNLALKFLLVSAGLISLFGIIQYYTNVGLPFRFWGYGPEVKRIVSVFEYPNALALYLGPLFGFFFTLWLYRSEIFSRFFYFLCLVAIALALFLTFSRGAWLAVILTLIVVFAKKYSAKIVLPIAGIGILLLFLIPAFSSRFLITFRDASSLAHWDLVKVGIDKVIQDPLLGNGLYGFRATLAQANFQGEILNYPHNIILNFWLEMGLLGVLSFFTLFYLSLKEYNRQPTSLKFAAAIFLLIVIIHGLVDVPYFKNDLSILFWFMLSVFFLNFTTPVIPKKI